MAIILSYLISIIGILIVFIIIKIICKDNKIKFKNAGYSVYKKVSRYRYIENLNQNIKEVSRYFNISKNVFNINTVLILSMFFSIIIYFASYSIVKIVSSSVIISIYSFFLPNYILAVIINKRNKKIMNFFPIYIINLKNYTNIKNDIIYAIKNVTVNKIIEPYINKFILSIESGIDVNSAIDELKTDINIKSLNSFFTSLQFCYANRRKFY